jgi:hypothetical protein
MKILNDIACNLNSNTLKLNSNTLNGIQIWLHWNLFEIKLNWREIRCKLVKNILKICSWQWYWRKTLKRHNFDKYTFPFLFIGELIKTNSSLELAKGLMKPKVVLPNLVLMINHCC